MEWFFTDFWSEIARWAIVLYFLTVHIELLNSKLKQRQLERELLNPNPPKGYGAVAKRAKTRWVSFCTSERLKFECPAVALMPSPVCGLAVRSLRFYELRVLEPRFFTRSDNHSTASG